MASDEEMEAFHRWVGYMPRLECIPDRELIVLKVHLVVEDALFHLLGLRLGVETRPLRRARIGFSALAAIALADKSVPLKIAVSRLNKVRNLAAHRLDDPKFDLGVETFVAAARRLPGGIQVVTSNDAIEVLRQAGNHTISGVYDEALPYWKI